MTPNKNDMEKSTWRMIDNLRHMAKQMDAIYQRDLLDAAARLQEHAELIEKMRSEMVHPDDLSQQMLKLVAGMNEAKAAQVRPEPSRLEIAAIILSGAYASHGSYNDLAKAALKQTDALIAAKEIK